MGLRMHALGALLARWRPAVEPALPLAVPPACAPPGCRFDRCVNALNRLPRPLLALATPALFAYAMHDPEGFSRRMQALALVPEPLWWLMGAVVAFYFGARETHYLRSPRAPRLTAAPDPDPDALAPENAALRDWRRLSPDSSG